MASIQTRTRSGGGRAASETQLVSSPAHAASKSTSPQQQQQRTNKTGSTSKASKKKRKINIADTADSRSSLFYDEKTLELLLHFAGQDQHLYIASVCRDWRIAYKKDCDPGHETETSIAAACGSLARFELACEYKDGFRSLWRSSLAQKVAGYYASQETLERALETGLPLGGHAACGAAAAGDFFKTQWLVRRMKHKLQNDICCDAAEGGSLELVIWLKGMGYDVATDAAMKAAASAGQLKMVLHLRSEGVSFGAHLLEPAAEGGALDMVQYLVLDASLPLNSSVIEAAAKGGQLHVVRWLRANDCPCRLNELCAIAGTGDYPDLLYWILDEFAEAIRDSTDDLDLMTAAVWHNEVPAFERLVKLLGEPDYSVYFEWGIAYRSYDLLEWILENHPDDVALTPQLYVEAFYREPGSEESVKARPQVLRMIRWLHEEMNCPWDAWSLAQHAARVYWRELLQYLHRQGERFSTEQFTELLMSAGAKSSNEEIRAGRLACFKWLRQKKAAWPKAPEGWLWADEVKRWAADNGFERLVAWRTASSRRRRRYY